MCFEGRGYKINTYNKAYGSFGFNGGSGMIQITQNGTTDFYFSKYDEHVSVDKPTILIKNIIFGTMYIDCGE